MARSKLARSASASLKAALAKPAPPTPPPAPAAPTSVTVRRPFEFYCDAGVLRRWQEGAVVTDPVEIAMLLERRAPLKEDAQ